jgi:hypothetical protein
MANVRVVLSAQDLGDFLEDNQKQMDAYASELQQRLGKQFDSAEVEISRNALSDKIAIDGEPDDGTVEAVMARMTENWDWLPE